MRTVRFADCSLTSRAPDPGGLRPADRSSSTRTAPRSPNPALAAGPLVAPFRGERTTGIKPSFLWLRYRSGWASKPGQERSWRWRSARRPDDSVIRIALAHPPHL
ncbi:DUF4291 family protein [Nocardia beijingensis]|uniref:DUF4291 family protein n=1 Tax=Nocardia beijingensis TaxID=95162 RepID=UPI0037B8DE01